ncbi:MAG TPA: MbnH family di-heme enzyme [Thermoanaerobaculia bacterium]|nr:MbnH family di-heme enzyme [Thermoanaerobaculia bacterium]
MAARPFVVHALLTLGVLSGCTSAPPQLRKPGHLLPVRTWVAPLPKGFDPPPVPADNPITPAKIELGRRLFYDKRLSRNGKQSCASCHQQAKAFTDGAAVATGSTGERHFRNAMTLTNVAYQPVFTWADRDVKSLEAQARIPIVNEHPVELGFGSTEDELVARIAADSDYRKRFAAAFPGDAKPVSMANIQRAIASFERILISGDSPYDRLVFGDDANALSESARRGMRLFFSDKIGCSNCHGGLNLSAPSKGERFRNTGLYDVDDRGSYPASDRGLAKTSGQGRDNGRFRIPTLRNVAVTAPYMHDGSVPTLSAVIDAYAAGGRARLGGHPRHRGVDVRPFAITAEEKRDLIAFLESLTDEKFLHDPRFGDPWQ